MKRSFIFLGTIYLSLCGLIARAQTILPSIPLTPAATSTTGTTTATPAGNPAAAPFQAVLKEFSITCDARGLGDYLRSLHPSADVQNVVAKFIAQLSDDDFPVRDNATKQLLRMPGVPLEPLEAAQAGPDPEASWRAKEILAQAGKKHEALLHAAMRTIALLGVKGLSGEVIESFGLCTNESLVGAAREALRATATDDDVEQLRRALGHRNLEVRVAAATALAQVLGAQGVDDMKRLVGSSDERIRLVASRSLAAIRDRACLEPLGQLLSAEDIRVRISAIQILRSVSGEKLPYMAHEDAATRKPKVEAWLKWIADAGPTARLHSLTEKPAELGRTLAAFYHTNNVIEYGPDNKTATWQIGAMRPWAVQGLANGHRLVASWAPQQITEYDETGKECWKANGLPGNPYSVERLENGNTLVALADASRIVEIKPDGSVTGEITIGGRATDAHRLPDGTTLVALQQQNKVAMIDSSGKELWYKTGCLSPSAVHRLDNGNTLVAEQGGQRVAEYDESGKEVWAYNGVAGPFDAARLDNGNTIIAHQQGLVEVDREGKEVSRTQGGLCVRLSHY